MYSWQKIAERTEIVYEDSREKVLAKKESVLPILAKYYECGPIYGKILCILFVLEMYLIYLIDRFWRPASEIDIAPGFDRQKLHEIVKDYHEKGLL